MPAGSYFGIVGSNGSGKTTLAFLIAGILKPSSGTIDTHGMRIGLVLSNPANQIVSLVVEEDIAFGPENMGLPSLEIKSRIGNALADVHGEHLRYALTSKLSGGQLAKVAYAGQLAMDVDILVLDEGTVMLDPASRKTLLKTIRELNTDLGKTVIHISHRLEDLESARGGPGACRMASSPTGLPGYSALSKNVQTSRYHRYRGRSAPALPQLFKGTRD